MSVSNVRTTPTREGKGAVRDAGIGRAGVEQAVGALQDIATGAGQTVILDSQDQIRDTLPAAWRDMVAKGHDKGLVQGFFYDGKTYLVAENLTSPAHAREIWLHEQIGHGGIEAVLGNQADAFYGQLQRDMGLPTLDAAREHLAEIVQKLNIGEKLTAQERTWWQKAIDWIRKFLFRQGVRPMYTRTELAGIIQESLPTTKYLDVIQAAAEHVFLGGPDMQAMSAGTMLSGIGSRAKPFWTYSEMESVLSKPGMLPKAATKSGMTNAIKKHVGKFKDVELEESGLLEHIESMQADTVTRQDVLDYLDMNRIRIEEVVKEGKRKAHNQEEAIMILAERDSFWNEDFSTWDEDSAGAEPTLADMLADRNDIAERVALLEEIASDQEHIEYDYVMGEMTSLMKDGEATRHNRPDLVTPGGENYREVLLKLPVKEDPSNILTPEELEFYNANVRSALGSLDSESEARMERITEKLNDTTTNYYESSHWPDDANVLLHLRMNERTDADGKRVLFVEEVQSDWHQTGRKEGYEAKGLLKELQRRVDAAKQKLVETEKKVKEEWVRRGISEGWDSRENLEMFVETIDAAWIAEKVGMKDELVAAHRELSRAKSDMAYDYEGGPVPDAPFKPTDRWAMLGMKRVIQEAVEQGFDRVAWTPGEAQADRYDLSKHIDKIEYEVFQKNGKDWYDVEAFKPDGTKVVFDEMTLKEVERTLGKELAAKIQEGQGEHIGGEYRDTKKLSGLDLKVGDKGMKGFYDKILPWEVGKYIKKWGAKVEQGDVGRKVEGTADGFVEWLADQGISAQDDLSAAEMTRLEREYRDSHGVEPGQPAWSFDVTPAMREAVTAHGQPLYAAVAPATETAREPGTAQERAQADVLMTHLDHIFGQVSPEAVGELVHKKGKSGLPADVRSMLAEGDMKLLSDLGLPYWLAKKYETFKKVFKREQDRREGANQMRAEAVREAEAFLKMDRATDAVVQDMLFGANGIEGKKIPEVIAERFVVETDAKGRPVRPFPHGGENLSLNPRYHAQLETALRKRFEPGQVWARHAAHADQAVTAYMSVRKMLDNKLIDIYDMLRAQKGFDPGQIQEFRNSVGMNMHNYFPHHRYGKYYIRAVDAAGETLYREHFDLNLKRFKGLKKKRALERESNKRIDALRAKVQGEGVTWEFGENKNLPEDVYAFPIPMDAMEQIMKAAQDNLYPDADKIVGYHLRKADPKDIEKAKAGLRKALDGLLPRSVADTLKERGFGSHFIQRKNIDGFVRDDLKRVAFDYVSGFSGWMTKIHAAKDFARIMGELDAQSRPREYAYTTQYVQDMLRNSEDVDRLAGNIKGVLFFSYLGANIKTAVLNLTQNVVLGVPRLAMDVGVGRAMRWYKDAGAALASSFKDGAALTADEQAMLKELLDKGITDARYLNEIRGRVAKAGLSTTWDKVLDIAGLPMKWSDRFNRASLALAAYRAARKGQVNNSKTLQKHGATRGRDMGHAEAAKFAAEVTTDAHFIYGKSNAPEFLRATKFGRAISPIYTFRTFMHNLLNAWLMMLREGGPNAVRGLGMSLVGTAAMGGLVSLPFYSTLLSVWNLMLGPLLGMGDDDDPAEAMRKKIPQLQGERPNLLRDMATYGLPAFFNVNLGGSIRLETPMVPNLQPGDSVSDAATNFFKDAMGVPWDFFIEKPSKAIEAARAGDRLRTFEELAPFFAKNVAQAVRFYKDGATAISGRPIATPGEMDPRRISLGEAVGKAVGFQPLSSTKAWDMHANLQRSLGVKQRKSSAWMNRLARAVRAGDRAEAESILQEISAWNAKALQNGEIWNIIRTEDIARAQQMRGKPKQAPRLARGRAAELAEMYE